MISLMGNEQRVNCISNYFESEAGEARELDR